MKEAMPVVRIGLQRIYDVRNDIDCVEITADGEVVADLVSEDGTPVLTWYKSDNSRRFSPSELAATITKAIARLRQS